MPNALIDEETWNLIGPLLPVSKPSVKGGRPRIGNREVLSGIIFVLRSGMPWEMLPRELGFGSGMTCWRRLRDWSKLGVWVQVHEALLKQLNSAGQIDWERASLDASSVRALKGAKRPVRIQRIAANRARSAILWSKPKGFRSPSRRPAQTRTK